MKRWAIAALVAAVVLVVLGRWAHAQEARPVAEVVAEATAESETPASVAVDDGKIVIDIPVWWNAMVEGVHALAGLAWKFAFTFLAGLLLTRIQDTKARADAKEALEIGVNQTWETLGKSWKKAASDGKFSPEEREKLKAEAIKGAKQIATGPGLKILKTWGQEQLAALIANIVEKRKAVAKKS